MVLEAKRPLPLWEILFSTHHTDIGLLYIITSVAFLIMGGALAMAIRAELYYPGTQIIPTSTDFHRIFTVHGTNMLFLWILPFASGVGNYLIPISNVLSKFSFFLLRYERYTHLYLLISVVVIYNNMSLLLICKHVQVQNQLPRRLEIQTIQSTLED